MDNPMAQIEALKPCPFCGSEAHEIEGTTGAWCRRCDFGLNTIDEWNTRALSPQPGHGEPVAWMGAHASGKVEMSRDKPAPSVMRDFNMQPLYLAPPTPAPDEAGVRAKFEAWDGHTDYSDYAAPLAGYRAALLGDSK